MTLDEAIRHCEEVAEKNETKAQKIGVQFLGTTKDKEATECRECAAEHRQLAEWLTELKEAKRLLKSATNVLNMFIPCDEDYNCRECIKYRQKCDYDDSFKWLYIDEALKLIGGETDEHS